MTVSSVIGLLAVTAATAAASFAGGGAEADDLGLSLLQRRAVTLSAEDEQDVVVTVSTLGNLDFVKNWAASLDAAGVKHYYVYAVGPGAYDGLSEILPGRVRDVPQEHIFYGSDLQANYGSTVEHFGYTSDDYSRLMLSVPGICEWLLEEVHPAFFYSDTDVVAFSNPFAAFPEGYRESFDLLGSTDSVLVAGDAWNTCNGAMLCGGMWWIQRTPAALSFLARWAELAKAAPLGSKNQPLYNDAVAFTKQPQYSNETALANLPQQSGLRLGLLSCERFPGGARYVRNRMWRTAPRRPEAMVHANLIVGGDEKRSALEAACLWHPDTGPPRGQANARDVLDERARTAGRFLLFNNAPARGNAHNLVKRLDLHRKALQIAFEHNFALVAVQPGEAPRGKWAAGRVEAENMMLGLDSSAALTHLSWEVDAASPLLDQACIDAVDDNELVSSLAASRNRREPHVLCLDFSSKIISAQQSLSTDKDPVRADLWYRRRARISRPAGRAFMPSGPIRLAVLLQGKRRLPDNGTVKLLQLVLNFLSDIGVQDVEVETMNPHRKYGPRGISADLDLLNLFSVPADLNVTAQRWRPQSAVGQSTKFLERLASSAVLVVPDAGTGQVSDGLSLWAARLSWGVVLTPEKLINADLLAERTAAGAVVPWSRDGAGSAGFDQEAFAAAYQAGCLQGWDAGVASKNWQHVAWKHKAKVAPETAAFVEHHEITVQPSWLSQVVLES